MGKWCSRTQRASILFATVLFAGAALYGSPEQETELNAQEEIGKGSPQLDKNFRFGTATHFANDWTVGEVMPLIDQLGVGWIRDEIKWREVERRKGEYEIPAKTRAWIEAAHARGIRVIVCLNFGNPLYEDSYDRDAYAATAAFIASVLHGKIGALEVLNEPSNFGFRAAYGGAWNGMEKDGSNSPWLEKYVALLNLTAEAVEKIDPNLPVIGLGAAPPANLRMLAIGLAEPVRGLTSHPYSYRSEPERIPFQGSLRFIERDGILAADGEGTFESQLALYRAVAAQFNGPRNIWLTEWGYSTFVFGNRDLKTLYSPVSEQTQAKYILRRFLEGWQLGVKVSIQYDFMDDGSNRNEPEQNFGLVTTRHRVKPAFDAVRRLIQKTQNFEIRESDELSVTWGGESANEKSSAKLKVVKLATPQGVKIAIIWLPVPAKETSAVSQVNITVKGGSERCTLTLTDLVNGEIQSIVATASQGATIEVKGVEVTDSPLMIEYSHLE